MRDGQGQWPICIGGSCVRAVLVGGGIRTACSVLTRAAQCAMWLTCPPRPGGDVESWKSIEGTPEYFPGWNGKGGMHSPNDPDFWNQHGKGFFIQHISEKKGPK